MKSSARRAQMLMRKLLALRAQIEDTETEIVRNLAEVERDQLYRELGHASLAAFATHLDRTVHASEPQLRLLPRVRRAKLA